MTIDSQRDVVFTPFMLRVREAVSSGSETEPTSVQFEPSGNCSIAVAVDEWFDLRAYAEHMIAEANAMLDPDVGKIHLQDEYSTGVLAFEFGLKGLSFRLFVDAHEPGHTACIKTGEELMTLPQKPAERRVLDDLVVNMLIHARQSVQ